MTPDSAEAHERLAVAWGETLDAHDRLIDALAAAVAAEDAHLGHRARYRWKRWIAGARADIAEFRAGGPPTVGSASP
jgi:hypothetical protein